MPVRIVTDSNCDLPPDLVARHKIVVVASVLNLAGNSYLDGVDLSRAEFYRRLPQLNPLPTTAAPAAGAFEAAYRSCGAADIVAVHLSSTFSAIFNAARLGAESLGDQVTVVDSLQVSMGLGWQVLAGAEVASAGGSRAATLAAIRSVQQRVSLLAALDTIEYLRRGGRASLLSAMLGEMLQIKPLLEVKNGSVITLARLRTRQKVREGLVARLEALGPLERLAVLHTDCLDDAQALARRLAPRASRPTLVVEATAVIGAHIGPGAIGVAAVAAATPQ